MPPRNCQRTSGCSSVSLSIGRSMRTRRPRASRSARCVWKSPAGRALRAVHLVLGFRALREPLQGTALPVFVPPPATRGLHLPYALARGEAVYAGEPVAIVVADSRHVAEDAAALVDVDYEPLPAVSDCAAAMMPGRPVPHAGSSSNIAARVPITPPNPPPAFAAPAPPAPSPLFI